MVRQRGSSSCAAIGSAVLVVSLWLPWYRFQIPDALLNQAVQAAQQFGILGPLLQQSAEVLRSLGPQHVDAWQVFSQTDVVLVVCGMVAGCLALLVYTERAAGVAGLIAAAGTIAFLVALHRVLSPPGPDGLLHPLFGAYLALAGSALIIAGGLWPRPARGDAGLPGLAGVPAVPGEWHAVPPPPAP